MYSVKETTIVGSETTISDVDITTIKMLTPDGTNTTPAHSFNSETDTGLFRDTATGKFCVCKKGNIKLTINDNDVSFDDVVIFWKRTTTERDALTPVAGMMIYNITTNQPEVYNGSAWKAMMVA